MFLKTIPKQLPIKSDEFTPPPLSIFQKFALVRGTLGNPGYKNVVSFQRIHFLF